jgi:hypothetical protein
MLQVMQHEVIMDMARSHARSTKARGAGAKGKFIRATISLDRQDYAALGKVAERMEVSASWLIRQALRDFLDKYGAQGQPELALHLAARRME